MENKKRQKSWLRRVAKSFRINPVTISGACDIIVCKNDKNELHSTSFVLQFGQSKILKPKGQKVQIFINDQPTKLEMILDSRGTAHFLYKNEDVLNMSQVEKPKSDINKSQSTDQSDIKQKIKKKTSVIKMTILERRNTTKIELSDCFGLITPDLTLKEKNQIFDVKKIDIQIFKLRPQHYLNRKPFIRRNGKLYDFHHGVKFIIKDFDIKNQNYQDIKFKSLYPPFDLLQELKLNKGVNKLTYQIVGSFYRNCRQDVELYYYENLNKKNVIISDVDGTITRSDIMGHIAHAFNISWFHPHIHQLYSLLEMNNYIVIYLTCRPIGYAQGTKKYLQQKQSGDFLLPKGPLFTTTGSFFDSLSTELIQKNPDKIKILILEEIKQIIGQNQFNPFFAGFGNKQTDYMVYRALDIKEEKIFIINKEGIIKKKINGSLKEINYLNIAENFDKHFGPLHQLILIKFQFNILSQLIS